MLIGIVGKPSVGKSTFFASATEVPVEISERPFTTIEPNHAVSYVAVECVDKEFGVQCQPRRGFCKKGKRVIPVELMDVAGLVPGAHEGKGLGNRFLDDLRKADVLIHVIDASATTNAFGERVVKGSYDPAEDILFLERELEKWVEGILKRHWARMVKVYAHKGEDALNEVISGLGVKLEIKEDIRGWGEEEIGALARRIVAKKPRLIAANKCDKEGALEVVKELRKRFPDKLIIPCSAAAELSLRTAAKKGYIEYLPGEGEFKVLKTLTEAQKKALDFLQEVLERLGGTGVQRVLNSAVFDLLRYVAVFPGGVNKLADSKGRVLPDVFLMPPHSTALDFAYAIHSDVGKGFIKAVDVRHKKAVGKDYILKHRDVIEVVFR